MTLVLINGVLRKRAAPGFNQEYIGIVGDSACQDLVYNTCKRQAVGSNPFGGILEKGEQKK